MEEPNNSAVPETLQSFITFMKDVLSKGASIESVELMPTKYVRYYGKHCSIKVSLVSKLPKRVDEFENVHDDENLIVIHRFASSCGGGESRATYLLWI